MNEFYTSIEVQILENGNYNVLWDNYTDYSQALHKLYSILEAASVSGIPYHAGYLLRSDGVITDGRVFDRRPVQEGEHE